MHLKLRKGTKEDYLKVGENRQGWDYRIIYKIMRSLEGGYFKGVLI